MALTKKMIDFCTEYVQSRNASESALKACYSVSYAKKKAYLLLENEEVQERISEIEQTYFDDGFKKLSLVALEKLGHIIEDDDNRHAQIRAVNLVLVASGILTSKGEFERLKSDVVFKVIIPEEYKEYNNLV